MPTSNRKSETTAGADETPTTSAGDHGEAEVQENFDEANDKGYFGVTTDPTPDENYAVPGVLAGKPTPETDEKQAAAVAEHQRNITRNLAGPGTKE